MQPESDYDSALDEEEFYSRDSFRSSDEMETSMEDGGAPEPGDGREPTCTAPGPVVPAGHAISSNNRTLYHPTFEAYYAAVAALRKAETPQMQSQRERGIVLNNGGYFYTDPTQPPGHRVYNCLSPATYNMFGVFRLVTPPPIPSPGIFVSRLDVSQSSEELEDAVVASASSYEWTAESSTSNVSDESMRSNPPQSFVGASGEGENVHTPEKCTMEESVHIGGSGRSLPESVHIVESGRSLSESVCSAESGWSFSESVCTAGSGRSLPESVCSAESRWSLCESVCTVEGGRSIPESVCAAQSGWSISESVHIAESGRSIPESVHIAECGRSLSESVCSAESGRSLPESVHTPSVIYADVPYSLSELEAVSALLHLSCSYPSSGGP